MKRRPLVYIAGPYRASTEREVVLNIRRAEEAAIEVWKAGGVAICPHLNTALFGGVLPDETWLSGDIEILRRCDAILMVGKWQDSKGARDELLFACDQGIRWEEFEYLISRARLATWIAARADRWAANHPEIPDSSSLTSSPTPTAHSLKDVFITEGRGE
ncbi:MAG: DUF4406 domain-containing protein [Pseudolabrys sp.]|nr:DUF4406 domain-containing protein [Pseudolabrys sp.]